MIIRPIVYQDRDKILRLLRQRVAFGEAEICVAMEVVDEALRCPEKRDYRIFCACRDSEDLAGYICFGAIPMTDGCYDLYWIAVDERLSGTGVGRMLLFFMEESVINERARRIYIETSSTPAYEAARSFYKKHHYDVVCVLADFYRVGDDKLVFMKEVHSAVAPGVGSIHAGEMPRQEQGCDFHVSNT